MELITNFRGIGRQIHKVDSLDQASKVFKGVRDSEDFGASSMCGNCGDVMDGGKLVARISYNGRIWNDKDELISEAVK